MCSCICQQRADALVYERGDRSFKRCQKTARQRADILPIPRKQTDRTSSPTETSHPSLPALTCPLARHLLHAEVVYLFLSKAHQYRASTTLAKDADTIHSRPSRWPHSPLGIGNSGARERKRRAGDQKREGRRAVLGRGRGCFLYVSPDFQFSPRAFLYSSSGCRVLDPGKRVQGAGRCPSSSSTLTSRTVCPVSRAVQVEICVLEICVSPIVWTIGPASYVRVGFWARAAAVCLRFSGAARIEATGSRSAFCLPSTFILDIKLVCP